MTNRLGAFELIRPLQRGGMGEVWSARHTHSGELVAIKLLHKGDQELAEALEREIRAMARLDHPHVVWIHDQGRVSGEVATQIGIAPESSWFAMEYCDAGTLREQPEASWAQQRDWLVRLLDALAHAHARGVLHRDLKPANILFRRVRGSGPVLKLSDFGIAHRLDTPGEAQRGGTLSWMAPEQFGLRNEPGPWTDLYAVGVLAFWLASGRMPYRAKGVEAWVAVHREGNPEPFLPRGPVPDGLAGWIARAMHREPRERFRRAADAAAAFAALDQATPAASAGAAAWPHTIAVTTGEHRLPARGTPSRVPSEWEVDVSFPRPGHLLAAGLRVFGLRTPPLVGRREERNLLWQAAREVDQTGSARVVILEAPAGQGKSRLAAWALERLHETGASESFLATHGPTGGSMEGLSGMLARALRADPADPEAVAEAAERALADPELRSAVCAFAQGGPRAIRFRTVASFCTALAEGRLPLVWLDDAQWGLEAIQFATWLVERRQPVLAVLTVQSEALLEQDDEADALAALARLNGVTRVGLGALSPRHRADLLRGLLHLDPGLTAAIDTRADGNPLFAVQLVTSLVERDALVPGPQGYRSREEVDLVPVSLRETWRQRLDPLLDGRPDWRRGLEVAAVLGMAVDGQEWALACHRLGSDGAVYLVSGE